MKTQIIIFLAFILIAISCNEEGNCAKDGPIYLAKETTYFYTETSVSSPIQGKIYMDDSVTILNGKETYWWKICYRGKNGWIAKEHLVFIDKDELNQKFLDGANDETSFTFFWLYMLIFSVLSFFVAFFIGKKRKIGFWYSFILGILLTPAISIFFTLFSKKRNVEEKKSKYNKYFMTLLGLIFIIMGLIIILNALREPYFYFQPFFIGIGLISYGFYLFK